MKVIVGSTNKAKVEAVEEILREYPHLAAAKVTKTDVSSDISAQPKSLEETVRGAMNRARNAFHDSDYAIGLESGLMEVPYTKSGYMDVCACAIYDGKEFHIGLSSGWEFPDKRITESILLEGIDMSQAINKFGLTKSETVGSEEGAVGILTKGRVDRKAYSKEALRMALIHIDPLD